QKKGLQAFQKEVDARMDKTLTAEQKKDLKERTGPGAGPAAFAALAPPGQLISTTMQIRLKLSTEQQKELTDLQSEVDAKLDGLLDEDQKKQFKEMREGFARGGPPGFGPGRGPGGPPGGPGGGGPGGPPGGPGGVFGQGGPPPFLFAGPPGGSALFRAYRYAPDSPSLAGIELTPGKTVEELDDPKPDNK